MQDISDSPKNLLETWEWLQEVDVPEELEHRQETLETALEKGGQIGTGTGYNRYKEYVEPVTDALKAIEQRGYSRHGVFSDWLDLMLYALQRRDDPYLEIVDQYSNDRPEGERGINYFVEAFGQLQHGMSQTDADLLGVVYEAYGQR